MPIIPDNN